MMRQTILSIHSLNWIRSTSTLDFFSGNYFHYETQNRRILKSSVYFLIQKYINLILKYVYFPLLVNLFCYMSLVYENKTQENENSQLYFIFKIIYFIRKMDKNKNTNKNKSESKSKKKYNINKYFFYLILIIMIFIYKKRFF